MKKNWDRMLWDAVGMLPDCHAHTESLCVGMLSACYLIAMRTRRLDSLPVLLSTSLFIVWVVIVWWVCSWCGGLRFSYDIVCYAGRPVHVENCPIQAFCNKKTNGLNGPIFCQRLHATCTEHGPFSKFSLKEEGEKVSNVCGYFAENINASTTPHHASGTENVGTAATAAACSLTKKECKAVGGLSTTLLTCVHV